MWRGKGDKENGRGGGSKEEEEEEAWGDIRGGGGKGEVRRRRERGGVKWRGREALLLDLCLLRSCLAEENSGENRGKYLKLVLTLKTEFAA